MKYEWWNYRFSDVFTYRFFFIKKETGTGFFLWILQIFLEHFFNRIPLS